MTWQSTKLLGALKYQIYIGERIWHIFHQSANLLQSYGGKSHVFMYFMSHDLHMSPSSLIKGACKLNARRISARPRFFRCLDSDGCSERRDHLNHCSGLCLMYTNVKSRLSRFLEWEHEQNIGNLQVTHSPYDEKEETWLDMVRSFSLHSWCLMKDQPSARLLLIQSGDD